MTGTTDGWWCELRRLTAPCERFVRDYTAGVRSRDLKRMLHQDTATAYAVLTRDQRVEPDGLGGLRLSLHRARLVFLGLSYKLTPPRRMLFAASLLAALAGVLRYDWWSSGVVVVVDDVLILFVAAVAGLVLLLGLELVDRIRFRDEVEVARQLQHDLLPSAAPVVPGYDFAFSYRTANDIGGDYYDFVPLADGRLAVIAGDASGHGIGAGLLMATAKAALRLALEVTTDPVRVARLVNTVLVDTGGKRAFMTLFFAVLEPPTGAFEFVTAGHPLPLVRRADGTVDELGRGAVPLGLRRDLELVAETAVLQPGEILLVTSDGLPEAVDPVTGAAFGFDRVRTLLAPGGSAGAVHDRAVAALAAFLGDAPPSDDVSLVVVARGA